MNNKAVKTLMDDPLMIGRHRPIIANWYAAWVDDVVVGKVFDEPPTDKDRAALRKELADTIAGSVQFIENKVPDMSEVTDEDKFGWRPGKSFPKGTKFKVELKAVVHAFREDKRGTEKAAAPGPKDSGAHMTSAKGATQ